MEYEVEIREVTIKKFLITACDEEDAKATALEGYLDGSIDPYEDNVDDRAVYAYEAGQ